jgi:hypothetical protein
MSEKRSPGPTFAAQPPVVAVFVSRNLRVKSFMGRDLTWESSAKETLV